MISHRVALQRISLGGLNNGLGLFSRPNCTTLFLYLNAIVSMTFRYVEEYGFLDGIRMSADC